MAGAGFATGSVTDSSSWGESWAEFTGFFSGLSVVFSGLSVVSVSLDGVGEPFISGTAGVGKSAAEPTLESGGNTAPCVGADRHSNSRVASIKSFQGMNLGFAKVISTLELGGSVGGLHR